MRIWVQGAEPIRIWKRILILILVKLLSHKKLNFYVENILTVGNGSKNTYEGTVPKPLRKAGNQVYIYIYILVDFHASGSGFPIRIRIRIRDSQTNAGPHPQHFFYHCMFVNYSSGFRRLCTKNIRWRHGGLGCQ